MNMLIKKAVVEGKMFLLRFYAAHDSGLGHFPDSWEITTVPANGKGSRRKQFQTFASAMKEFNKRACA